MHPEMRRAIGGDGRKSRREALEEPSCHWKASDATGLQKGHLKLLTDQKFVVVIKKKKYNLAIQFRKKNIPRNTQHLFNITSRLSTS